MRNTILILLLTVLFHNTLLNGQLRINEVIALNNSGKINPLTNAYGDWIEIYNSGTEDINIGHYYLSDTPEVPFMWMFPENTVVPSDGFIIVWADGTGDTLNGLHANFKLDVAGETLGFYTDRRAIVDKLSYPRMYEDVSFGYWGGEYVYLRSPSWKEDNLYSEPFEVSGKLQFSPPGGIYPNGKIIYISPVSGTGTIRYTVDGSEPGLDDPVYQGKLEARGDIIVRARLFTEGAEPGDVATASYFIQKNYTLPVISLATDPVGLWDDQEGIYVTGTNGITGNCSEIPRNWNQPWEKKMSFEYFGLDGSLAFQFNGGMKIHGGCSRGFSMKSLGIFARSIYGQSSMEYPFFREKNLNNFKGLILRNGGNDFNYSFIRDGVIQASVHSVMDLDHQAYEPVQVYLNGDYWGIHNLREKVNEHWVTSNYGIPAENVDFLKNNWEVFSGTRDAYDELTEYLEDNSLASDAKYQWVADRVDINSYQDYLITQFFYANRDWPGNNQKYWRDHVNNSKWRWILFDLEFSMGLYDFDPSLDMFSFATLPNGNDWPNPAWATLPIRRLLENEGFREQFLAKYMIHLNTTFAPERIIGIIDSLQNHIYNDFPANIERWKHTSMAGWESRVEELRRFARQRPDNVWNNMRNYFSLGSVINMYVEESGAGGSINANSVDIPLEGFTGKYLAGSPLNLRYDANPGYRFSHWEVNAGESSEISLIQRNSSWKYLDTGVWPGLQWTENSYDDSSWPDGQGILGYGDGNESTELDYGGDPQDKVITYYFRKSIEISDLSQFDSFEIDLVRDDGAVVYVNGTEVLRNNMPDGNIEQNTYASTFVGDSEETTYFSFPLDNAYFVSGSNTLAVEVHQNSSTSSDLKFDLELKAAKVSEAGFEEYTSNPLILYPGTDISIRAVSEIEQLELELRINEIMANNIGAVEDEYGNDSDWIEIYNMGDEQVDMAGLYLTDNLDNPSKWRIPHGFPGETAIDPKGYLVLYADENPALGPRHLDFKLDSKGESLGISYLAGGQTIWIDSLSYSKQFTNISSGYLPDGTGEWVELEYTPGSKNVALKLSVQPYQTMEIALYPNPARDLINIRISIPDLDMNEEADIQIYDLTGRRLISMTRTLWNGSLDEQLDVSQLPGAVYLLVVETPSGTHSCKFVKSAQ